MESSKWTLYDELVSGIDEKRRILDIKVGENWIAIVSDTNEIGVSIGLENPEILQLEDYLNQPLIEVAKMIKSWNFDLASVGVAAMNAFYNQSKTVDKLLECGFCYDEGNAFDEYYEQIKGKKVAVIGRFPYIEKKYKDVCELSIIERNYQGNEYPDSASEYILPEQDYVFITASTLQNKTLPRLLELSKNSVCILVGPSLVLSKVMFNHGIDVCCGFMVDNSKIINEIKSTQNIFGYGKMMRLSNEK